jgi:hypothetical protein
MFVADRGGASVDEVSSIASRSTKTTSAIAFPSPVARTYRLRIGFPVVATGQALGDTYAAFHAKHTFARPPSALRDEERATPIARFDGSAVRSPPKQLDREVAE